MAATKKKHPWKIYTLTDAYAPRPPIQYAVDGLFALPSLSIIYGAPGTLKSMLLIDLAVCVVGGTPWLPSLPGKPGSGRAATQSAVLWADLDNGIRTMHERIGSMSFARNLSKTAPLYYVSMPVPWLDALNFTSVSQLIQLVLSLQARLIILDNLCTISGQADENSAQMGTVMSNLRRLSEDTGAAVCVIHHQRKSNGTRGRAGDTLRGHSSIEAAIDLALLVEREENASDIELKATKVRGADVLPFGAMFTYKHRPNTKELVEAKFFGMEVEDLTSDAAIRRTVLDLVTSNTGINQGDLVTAAKAELAQDVGKGRVKGQINKLVSQGKLSVTAGSHNAKLYSTSKIDPLDAAIMGMRS